MNEIIGIKPVIAKIVYHDLVSGEIIYSGELPGDSVAGEPEDRFGNLVIVKTFVKMPDRAYGKDEFYFRVNAVQGCMKFTESRHDIIDLHELPLKIIGWQFMTVCNDFARFFIDINYGCSQSEDNPFILAEEIGASIKLFRFDSISEKKLLVLVEKLNNDPLVHGIIVQRPFPDNIDRDKVSILINPEKDVDGFSARSNFDPPVALAVLEILKSIGIEKLDNKKIAVIGKGETAGGPIIKLLNKHGVKPEIIDSQTKNPNELISSAEIIISAVGKENIINKSLLNSSQTLIGVGLFAKNGKLKGDYDEDIVSGKVKYFTPTPGGVGPVNVACLMQNLINASYNLSHS